MSNIDQLPPVSVLLDDTVLPETIAHGIESIEVTQVVDMPAHCELTLLLEHSTASPFTVGAELVVNVGEPEHVLFRGEIIALRTQLLDSHNRRLVIRSYDKLHRLRKTQPVRQFKETSLHELIRQLLAPLALTTAKPSSPVAELLDAKRENVCQWCQSDWRLLVEQCHQYGLHCQLVDDQLTVFNILEGDTALHIDMQNVQSLTVEESAEPACREVSINSWDSRSSAVFSAQASADKENNIAELNTHLAPELWALSGEVNLGNYTSEDKRHAHYQAQASLQARLAGEVVVQALVDGRADLSAGCRVSIDTTGDASLPVINRVATQVCHTLTRAQGYTTRFDTVPPARLQPATIDSALAVVINIDDPEHAGRVQVRYPCLSDLESLWLPVVTAGASSKKGLLVLPDVDDEVLVMFTRGDIHQGIVLGGLFGRNTLPKPKIKNDSQQIFNFTTGRGHALVLDNSRGAATLKNRDGSYIDLAPNKVTLYADADLHIEAPGKNLVIKASSVDFQQE